MSKHAPNELAVSEISAMNLVIKAWVDKRRLEFIFVYHTPPRPPHGPSNHKRSHIVLPVWPLAHLKQPRFCNMCFIQSNRCIKILTNDGPNIGCHVALHQWMPPGVDCCTAEPTGHIHHHAMLYLTRRWGWPSKTSCEHMKLRQSLTPHNLFQPDRSSNIFNVRGFLSIHAYLILFIPLPSYKPKA